jgi:hypothetical protein
MNGYITLDYELGMGEITGTPDKCLVEPMNHLTAMTDKYGIKMNVFVDAAYLLQMRKLKDVYPKLQNDYKTVINHIKKLDTEGHAIQLHLHPQWYYSTFDGEKWTLDVDHYKLSDMPLNEQNQLIIEGVELLNGISTRRVSAFRAGGYSVENFPELYETFLSVGINIDSSVLRGEYSKGKYQSYDYRIVPNKTIWHFDKNHKTDNSKGQMTEFPISTIALPSILYLINKRAKHKELADITSSKKRWGDGIGIGHPGNKLQVLIKKAEMLFGKKSIRASIDVGVDLEKVFYYSKKHYIGDDFVIIGHPKAISQFSVDVLERFIISHPEIDFVLFS